jgi:lauroyl/myristoyl acyltransferase
VALARKLNVPMVFAFLVREGGSLRRRTHRFQLIRSELFDVPRTEDEKMDLLRGTQEWTSRLEDVIRRYPEQWCWTYPRWRSTPERPRLPHPQRSKDPEPELVEAAANERRAAHRARLPVARS